MLLLSPPLYDQDQCDRAWGPDITILTIFGSLGHALSSVVSVQPFEVFANICSWSNLVAFRPLGHFVEP